DPPYCPRLYGRGVVRPARGHQVLCQFSVLLEVGSRRERQRVLRIRVHTNLLSCAPGVRSCQAERRFVLFEREWVGTALSADWMRPVRGISIDKTTLAGGSRTREAPISRKPFDLLSQGHETGNWRGRRDSNPRPLPLQATLPTPPTTTP